MKSREGTVVDADELMEEMVQEARNAAVRSSASWMIFPKRRRTCCSNRSAWPR
jgi:hypothetical protein